ncbi:unnamed protein product [Orchesella dallaii]|uniref:Uncharacterized protein n=1 Tax=Orchesella dallaii TaxID=48710 RepID=A0ABP1QZA6_9HEXA
MPYYKWIPWCIMMSGLGLTGVLCAFASLKYSYFAPQSGFQAINLIILSCVSFAIFCICEITITAARHIHPTCYAFNRAFQLEKELLEKVMTAEELAQYKGSAQEKSTGILVIIITSLGVWAPIVMAVAAIISDYDAFYFIIEYEFMPDPFQRERDIIFLTCGIRFLCVLATTLECTRTLLTAVGMFIPFFDRGMVVMGIMATKIYTHDEFKKVYVEVMILFKIVEPFLYSLVYIGLTFTFWLVVGFAWITIKGFGKLPMWMYLVCAPLTFAMAVCYLVVFPMYLQLPMGLAHLVDKNRQRARREYAGSTVKTVKKKAAWLEAKALAKIKIKYGPFFYLHEAVIPEQLCLISERICDAILLVDFN